MGTGSKIEVLYGEFANLFGELQNVNFLFFIDTES